MGLSVDLQWKIFRLLSALLHIGNINITGRNDALLSDTDPALATSSRLLGINADEFRKWIVKKQIITRSEKIVTNLTPVQANVVRDSVAKYIYSNLFDWLVGVINESLSCSDEQSTVKNFIGVLDIYGFEHFKQNSFEQFCINYANEKLQQQFNQHVFKLEQEEYMREKINWTFIEFSDNQKCIEMIEGRLGILSLLDEVSYMCTIITSTLTHSCRSHDYLRVQIKLSAKSCMTILQHQSTRNILRSHAFQTKHLPLNIMLTKCNMKLRTFWKRTKTHYPMNIWKCFEIQNSISWKRSFPSLCLLLKQWPLQ